MKCKCCGKEVAEGIEFCQECKERYPGLFGDVEDKVPEEKAPPKVKKTKPAKMEKPKPQAKPIDYTKTTYSSSSSSSSTSYNSGSSLSSGSSFSSSSSSTYNSYTPPKTTTSKSYNSSSRFRHDGNYIFYKFGGALLACIFSFFLLIFATAGLSTGAISSVVPKIICLILCILNLKKCFGLIKTFNMVRKCDVRVSPILTLIFSIQAAVYTAISIIVTLTSF